MTEQEKKLEVLKNLEALREKEYEIWQAVSPTEMHDKWGSVLGHEHLWPLMRFRSCLEMGDSHIKEAIFILDMQTRNSGSTEPQND